MDSSPRLVAVLFSHSYEEKNGFFSWTGCRLILPQLRVEKWIHLLDWLPSYFPIVKTRKMDSPPRLVALLFSHSKDKKNGFFSQTGCRLIFPQLRVEKWILLIDWLPSYFPIVKTRKIDSSPRLVALLFSQSKDENNRFFSQTGCTLIFPQIRREK